jgi:hypothetical protein
MMENNPGRSRRCLKEDFMKSLQIGVEGMTCASCVGRVERP